MTLAARPVSAGGIPATLDTLARGIWDWRRLAQPLEHDDIPRLERPVGWVPDWSAEAVARQRQDLAGFETRWRALAGEATAWPVPHQVDYRLLGSALARVRWELDVTRGWQRNPLFYVDQTLGAIFERLLQPAPIDASRAGEIVRRMRSIPATVRHGRANLAGEAVGPFARLAVERLANVRQRLRTVVSALAAHLDAESVARLGPAADDAVVALEGLRDWLTAELPSMSSETAVGRDAYVSFLKEVALTPFTPEQLLAMGRQEWERAVAFETLETIRNRHLPLLALPRDVEAQIARERADELAVRRFCEERGLLSFPAGLPHYLNLPMPAYLEPLRDVGVTDDLTDPSRLDQDGTSYVPPPSPSLPYFYLANARDPRVGIAHEGMHYFQLALSWRHEDWIRRHYYDSGPNEGIAFYAEEMLLQAGLFEDSPRSREIIYNFMRLRALRVEVDVSLSIGRYDIRQAAEHMARTVPMDLETALQEAASFASRPGQAITYQIGKLQIVRLLADARCAQGDTFDPRAFHDSLWKNGNVPLSLQRWELLGLRDELDIVEAM